VEHRIKIGSADLYVALEPFLRAYKTTRERINAVQTALESEAGKFWRLELAKWTTRVVTVELLVPEEYRQWRPLVRDAMRFVVSRLSPARLAPKVVEQVELPPDTPAEKRLLLFIAKVPGLQKIGQGVARNRNLDPRLRRALVELENGISDVTPEEIRRVIERELGPRIDSYAIKIDSAMLSEASVAAVIGFTWRNPETGHREPGVFKVLKPHIPSCYAEDMAILQKLAAHLARKHKSSGVRLTGVAETLTEIRLLLEREVDFRREQNTLLTGLPEYRSVPGVRIPRLIPQLCAPTVTALSRETGVKITDAFASRSAPRGAVAQRLAEALMAIPALALEQDAVFHADPHAGNLLYDKRHQQLVILDWALTERLTRQQRQNVLMLVLMLMLHDADGVSSAIMRLRLHRGSNDAEEERIIRDHTRRFLDALPLFNLPGAMDAMRLLDEIALEGVRFPAALLMFRKASFTLDGVLEDVAGSSVRMDTVITRYALEHWLKTGAALWMLLSPRDWVALDWSLVTYLFRAFPRFLNPRMAEQFQ